ncbi:MAG: hypothetical protein R2788_14370 [Saprospiraceae bacterium]
MKKTTAILLYWLFCIPNLFAQHSVARLWNEVTLDGIRGDFARPTVHARLIHTSVAMYDAWAIYSGKAETYFWAKRSKGYTCSFSGTPIPGKLSIGTGRSN